jgi:hypothetical protein
MFIHMCHFVMNSGNVIFTSSMRPLRVGQEPIKGAPLAKPGIVEEIPGPTCPEAQRYFSFNALDLLWGQRLRVLWAKSVLK